MIYENWQDKINLDTTPEQMISTNSWYIGNNLKETENVNKISHSTLKYTVCNYVSSETNYWVKTLSWSTLHIPTVFFYSHFTVLRFATQNIKMSLNYNFALTLVVMFPFNTKEVSKVYNPKICLLGILIILHWSIVSNRCGRSSEKQVEVTAVKQFLRF